MIKVRHQKIVIFLTLILLTIISIISNTKATTVTNTIIDDEIISKLQNQEKVRAIIMLKNPNKIDFVSLKDQNKKNQLFQSELATINNVQSQVISSITESDFKIKYKYSTIFAISGEITQQGLNKLEHNPNVLTIYFPAKGTESLSESIPLINADDVWNKQIDGIKINGTNETLCIIDSGVDYTHSDLGDCTQSEFLSGDCEKVIGGYDFVDDDPNPNDLTGHGTHVAAIAASNGYLDGVAPNAKILALKVVNSSGEWLEEDLTAAIDWCRLNQTVYGSSIISISLNILDLARSSFSCYPERAVSQAIDNAVNIQNIFVAVSSGNQDYSDGIYYPACVEDATSVGASNDNDIMWASTTSGPNLDLLGPGIDIEAAKSSTIVCHPSPSCSCDGNYMTCSGTSMATPHVSGAAALLQQFNKLKYGTSLTPDEIRDILKNTGKDIQDGNRKFPRIDVLAAINQLDQKIKANGQLHSGKVYENTYWWTGLNITNSSGYNLTVTLIKRNHNDDLDLTLLNPSETEYTVTKSIYSTEIIELKSSDLTDGIWKIKVYGSDLASNPSSFHVKAELDKQNISLGGINFTSTEIAFISTCNPETEDFKFILKAKEAQPGDTIIDVNERANNLLTYFKTALTIPDHEQWVSLPIGGVVIDPTFAETEVGQQMLEDDVDLKHSYIDEGEPSMIQDIYDYWFATGGSGMPDWWFRTAIKPGSVTVNATNCEIFVVNATLSGETELMAASGSHPNITQWENYFIDKLENERLPAIIEDLNNDDEFKKLRDEVLPAIALAQWYKRLDRSKIQYGDLIDTKNITGLEADQQFDEEYWKQQSQQFLYWIPGYSGYYIYGGVAFWNSAVTDTGDVSEETRDLMEETLTKSYIKQNDTYYFSLESSANQADLSPLALSFSSLTPQSEQTINITIAVENIGLANSEPSTAYFYYEYTYPNGYKAKRSISTSELLSVNAGDIILVNTTFSSSELGDYNITAELDYNNDVTEINELNNEISEVIEVLDPYPAAVIISPAANYQTLVYNSTTFIGYGTDLQDGYLTDLNWTSNIDGYLGNETTITVGLSVGSHIVTLTVTDGDGHIATDAVAVGVLASQPPTVSISSPLNGEVIPEGATVYFDGIANDPEDGSLSGSSLNWSSDIDGFLSNGGSFNTKSLSVGTHTITFSAVDSNGGVGSTSISLVIEEGSPTLSITKPSNNQVFAYIANINFTATATDPQDGTLSPTWTSNIDDNIGSGSEFNRSLSIGTHTITAYIIDSHGNTAIQEISISVLPPQYPSLSIKSPRSSSQYTHPVNITFKGVASDFEDGSLTGNSVNWTSSVDGFINNGDSFSYNSSNLAVGDHTITFSAIDSDSMVSSVSFDKNPAENKGEGL